MGIIVYSVTLILLGVVAYAVGHAHGRAQGMEWGAAAVEDMRRRAMMLLQRSRVKYEIEELDDPETSTTGTC